MKKAFLLFDQANLPYDFIDYKKSKPNEVLVESFLEKTDLDELINKRGTTFKKLSEEQKALLQIKDTAIPLIIENSSMIKRPVVQFTDGRLIIGYQEKEILDKVKEMR